MRRLVLSLVLLQFASTALAGTASAQQVPRGGIVPMRPCSPDCDPPPDTPPTVELWAPIGQTSEQYPLIKIQFCDDHGLDPDSRYITVNGVDRTSAFDYVSPGFPECVTGDEKYSNTTSVPLNVGTNTIYARICDYLDHCTSQTWYVERTSVGAPVVALRNHNADNRDRGLCLTVGAGQAAGLSCGDLFVTHGLPAYRTLGRDRSLTLFYNSAAAAPRPVVAVAVTEPAGMEAPISVYAELKVNGAVRAAASYTTIAVGATAQIALAYDASADASGIYPFTLEVRNVYSGSSQSTFVSGELLVANRSGSEFGAGWWLAGVEQLVLGQSGSRILWLGGDGSAAVYSPAGTNRWARAAGAYRDTLVLAGARYTRYLRHGVRVVFDAITGRHIRTVTRADQTTVFTWDSIPGVGWRLSSVRVPPDSVSGPLYTLAYQGPYRLIDWIQDPSGRVLDPNVATYLYGTKYAVTSITDPDGQGVTFGYDGVGRMTSRRSRRNFTTTYQYANGRHVTRIARPLAPGLAPPADSARDTLQWWDERGLAIGTPGGTLTAVDTAQAYTQVNGPRTDVADIAKFWVDRWGAPTRIQDPIGAVTTITRGDPAMPALPTKLVSPVGQVWGMAYDARGNLLYQADSTHEGHGPDQGFQTATTRYTYNDAVNPWAPDSVIDPEGVVSRIQYDTLGPSVATAPNGHQTQFRYVRTGALRGLVDSIVELQVPTYTDTLSWGLSAPAADQRTRFHYNTLGNLDSTRSPMDAVTRYAYNAYTQVIRQVSPTGDTTRFFPRPMGVVDSVVQVDPAGPDRLYASTFDADFNRLSLVDRRNVTRQWHFDAAGRDTAEVDDYGFAERRFYGPSGLLDAVRTRAGASVIVNRTYDAAGRLTQISYPARMSGDTARGDTVTFTYDLAGRMLTAFNRSARTYRSYYREGTIRQDSQALVFYPTGQATYQYRYDRSDRRTRTTSFRSSSDVMQVDYQYALDQLQRIIIDYPGSTPATDTAVYTWDALGRRQQLLAPHGATVRWFYDRDGRVRRVYSTHTCVNGPSYCPQPYDSANVDRRFWAYDRSGRPTILSERVGNHPTADTSAFTYDAFGQMWSRWHSGRQRDYTFDLSGNITAEFYTIGSSTSGRTYTVAAGHNRLIADTAWSQQGGVPTPRLRYLYTNAGERRLDSAIYDVKLLRRMWYDALGRMTSSLSVATSQGSVVDVGDGGADTLFYTAISPIWYVDDCRYDALGRRVRACMGSNMLFDGDNADFIGGFWPARVVYGPGTNDPLVVYYKDGGGWPYLQYFITDGGGRLISYTDSTGKDARVGTGNIYNEYAVHAGAVNEAESFGGSGSEVSGQPDVSFFRNRYYDQRTGRWLTEDPIGVAGGANLYQYVGNNPATFTDPFGLCPIPPESCLGREGVDLVVGSTPGASTLADAITVISGRNVVTGDDVGLGGRALAFAGLITPAGGGQIRAAGKAITRVTEDFANRVIERGIRPGAILDALRRPLRVRDVKIDELGRPSQQIIGREATVVQNPETGDLITTWQTSTKTRTRLENQQ